MSNPVFTSGVTPGGLTSDYEIRLAICYLLWKLNRPLTFEQINDCFQFDGLLNYFEFSQALQQLQDMGHIQKESTGEDQARYRLTGQGVQAAAEFEHSIPLSVREKAVQAGQQMLLREKRLRDNRVEYHKVEDGYQLNIRLSDFGSDLMRLTVFFATEEECLQAKRRFFEDPPAVYAGIMQALCGGPEEA